MNKRDENLLRHIVEAIENVDEFLGALSYEEFCRDKKTIAAIIRQLEIVGEASAHISKEFLNTHTELSAHDAIGMRNILIHEYFNVDVKVVWDTCKENLPALHKIVIGLLDS